MVPEIVNGFSIKMESCGILRTTRSTSRSGDFITVFNGTWDVAAGPGDCGRVEMDGVPVRFRKGEPGLRGGVPGLEGVWTCWGEPRRDGVFEGTMPPRWR